MKTGLYVLCKVRTTIQLDNYFNKTLINPIPKPVEHGNTSVIVIWAL